MACTLTLSGSVSVGGSGCSCVGFASGGSTAPSSKTMGLSFACSGSSYAGITSTDCPTQVTTAGSPGDNFIDLPGSESIGDIQLLSVKTSAPMVLRIGAGPAKLVGDPITLPLTFPVSGSFEYEVDGQVVNGTVPGATYNSVSEFITILNQAAVAAGLSFLPASISPSGTIQFTGQKTGSNGSINLDSFPPVLGFVVPVSAVGEGSDIHVNGTFLAQFDASNAPKSIQISGNAQVEVLAAGSAV